MAETQLKIAIAIRSAAEELAGAVDSLESSAGIVAIDLENGDEPSRLDADIKRVKADYAKLLLALEGYEAP